VELVFLNTCGFISSGREEALATVKKLLKKGKKVCITGCAVKYREDLTNSKDEERTAIKPQISIYPRNEIGQLFMTSTPRALTNIDNKFEYLKIAEGCNNACSFCIIPKIRGKQISLPIPTILQEIRNLIQQGAEEIILIAQDSTRYGTDLYGKPQLFELLEQIEQVEGNFHYRVLYLYPDLLTLHQLKKLTSFKKFIPYFDIPLQHISSSVLQRMGRFYDEQAIYTFLNFIKSEFPIHFIRTNFIIGFP
jgi:ribosomal protein S12 methylthiotransferase